MVTHKHTHPCTYGGFFEECVVYPEVNISPPEPLLQHWRNIGNSALVHLYSDMVEKVMVTVTVTV